MAFLLKTQHGLVGFFPRPVECQARVPVLSGIQFGNALLIQGPRSVSCSLEHYLSLGSSHFGVLMYPVADEDVPMSCLLGPPKLPFDQHICVR